MQDEKQKLLDLKKSLEHERDELKKFLSDFHEALEKAKAESSSPNDMVKKVKEVVDKHDGTSVSKKRK